MAQEQVILTGVNFAANGASASLANDYVLRHMLSRYNGANVAFGSGTLKVQVSPDGGTTWLDYPSTSQTSGVANQKWQHTEVMGPMFRVNLTGATAPNIDQHYVLRAVDAGVVKEFSFSADGNSQVFMRPERSFRRFVMAAWGTWGSGTLKAQYSIDGGTTWLDDEDGSLTANGMAEVEASEFGVDADNVARATHTMWRLNLSGATSPSLTAHLYF
jgi:hypothetical protein